MEGYIGPAELGNLFVIYSSTDQQTSTDVKAALGLSDDDHTRSPEVEETVGWHTIRTFSNK